ncbi:MAG: hypothetical protein AAF757_00415 [Cyanobacteria bacterium P01_D01_bin.116]
MYTDNISPVTIYIPTIDKWASITGACLKDNQFRLTYKTDDNDFGFMALDTAQLLVKLFPTPF